MKQETRQPPDDPRLAAVWSGLPNWRRYSIAKERYVLVPGGRIVKLTELTDFHIEQLTKEAA